MTTHRPPRAAVLAPASVVAFVVAYGLVVLRPLLARVETPNDFGMHLSMVRWATARLAAGHLPFDGWFPSLQLGSPQFSQYPTLAHVLAAVPAQVLDEGAVLRWSAYLLLATWPVAVYLGSRLAGLDRWQSAGAAAVSPFLVSRTSYGLELSTYVFRGFGIWPQIWAAWTLPIALGLAVRAVAGRGRLWHAAAAIGVTFALHFVTGYVCMVVVVLAAVVVTALERTWRPLARGAVVVAVGLVTFAYVIVPLVLQRGWASYPGLDRRTVGGAVLPVGTALSSLVRGQLYDNGRVPVLTLLVAVGIVVCLVRRRPTDVLVAALWSGAVAVFALGAHLPLPGTDDLFTRFVIGVHLTGILAAGVGLDALTRPTVAWLARRLTPPEEAVSPPYARIAGAVVAVAVVLLLLPAWRSTIRYERVDARFVRTQQRADATEGAALQSLVSTIARTGPGRTYAGSSSGRGADDRIGYVPVYVWLSNHSVDAIGNLGRVASLSATTEADFLAPVPGDYPLFAVRYLLLPAGQSPAPGVTAHVLASAGAHVLWEVDGVDGYVQTADVQGAVTTGRATLARDVQSFVAGVPVHPTVVPGLRLPGAPRPPAGPATAIPADGAAPGVVRAEHDTPDDGRYVADVSMDRAGTVLLRSSFTTKWHVRVDGAAAPTYAVAPSYVAVTVPAGDHRVEFAYRPFGHYPELLVLGLATHVALALLERRRGRPSHAARRADPAAASG